MSARDRSMLTTTELARLLGVSPVTVRVWVWRKELAPDGIAPFGERENLLFTRATAERQRQRQLAKRARRAA